MKVDLFDSFEVFLFEMMRRSGSLTVAIGIQLTGMMLLSLPGR